MSSRIRWIGLGLVLLVLLVVSAWKIAYPTHSWRQKITLTVETPDGEKSASSVVEVNVHWQQDIAGIGGVRNSWRGEAVVLELGEERYLFALLGHPAYMAIESFREHIPEGISSRRGVKSLTARIRQFGGEVPVDREYYPLFVTFDDIMDPTTVKRVDPSDFAASFGEGFDFVSLNLEITTEAVTEKIETKLIWLEEVGRSRASLIPYPKGVKSSELRDPEIQLLSTIGFSTELFR